MTAVASKPKPRSLSCTEREWSIIKASTPAGTSTNRWLIDRALTVDPTVNDPGPALTGDARLLELAETIASLLGPMEPNDENAYGSGATMRQEIRFLFEKAIKEMGSTEEGEAMMRRILDEVARDKREREQPCP